MSLLIPDLDGDIVPSILPQAVIRAQEREEMKDRTIHLVLEIMTIPFLPILHEIARGNRPLSDFRADGCFEADPVGIRRDVVPHQGSAVIDPGHAFFRFQSILLSCPILTQFSSFVVSDGRQQTAVDECAVVDDRRTHPGE